MSVCVVYVCVCPLCVDVYLCVIFLLLPLCHASMEKITRLEAENKRLTEAQCNEAEERLVELENNLEDLTRLKNTFEAVS